MAIVPNETVFFQRKFCKLCNVSVFLLISHNKCKCIIIIII